MPCVTSITRRFSSICPHSFLCKVAFYYLLCAPSYSSLIHWTNRIFFVQEQKDLWMNNPSDFWEREKNLRQIPGLLTFLAGTWPSQVGYKREARVNLSSQQLLLRRDKELVNFLFLPPPLIWQIHSLEFRIFLISRPTFLFSSQPLLSLIRSFVSSIWLFPVSSIYLLPLAVSSVSSFHLLHSLLRCPVPSKLYFFVCFSFSTDLLWSNSHIFNSWTPVFSLHFLPLNSASILLFIRSFPFKTSCFAPWCDHCSGPCSYFP